MPVLLALMKTIIDVSLMSRAKMALSGILPISDVFAHQDKSTMEITVLSVHPKKFGMWLMDVFALKVPSILELLVKLYPRISAQLYLMLFGKLISVDAGQDSPKLPSSVFVTELKLEIFAINAHTSQTLN